MKDALSSAQQARREFLEKAGKLAIYTTPTLMVLMHPGPHAIASGCSNSGQGQGSPNANACTNPGNGPGNPPATGPGSNPGKGPG